MGSTGQVRGLLSLCLHLSLILRSGDDCTFYCRSVTRWHQSGWNGNSWTGEGPRRCCKAREEMGGDVRILNPYDSFISFMSSLQYWMAFNLETSSVLLWYCDLHQGVSPIKVLAAHYFAFLINTCSVLFSGQVAYHGVYFPFYSGMNRNDILQAFW